jgi:hypothetical protein
MEPRPEDLEQMSLYEHLRSLGEQMLAEPDFHRDALEGVLDEVLDDIQALHRGYQDPAPPGGEVVQAFVVEALDLYTQCVEAMKSYLEDPEETLLQQGLDRAEEAEDLLVAVEMVIQENKELLDGGRMS